MRFERVGGDEVRALVPFAVSEGMVLSDGFATVDPYKLARGLRRLLLESGVAVYEHSKVAALRPGMAGVELEMQSGPRLRARKVVLATSLYTSRLAGIGRGTGLGGAYTYVVATEPLDDDTLASLGPALHCGVVAEARIKYAYARTHQRRLLLGGRTRLVRTVDATAESDERAYRSLYSELQRRFPFLAGVRVAAGWSGPVHIATMARMPIVRPAASDPRVILNVGYNVDGMSLALLSGKMVANLVVGERPLDAEAEGVRQVYLTTRMGLRECLQMAPWLLRN